jgi:cytochrome c oxidase subunit 2
MQFDFQDPVTPIMEGIIDFHHDIQFYLIVIVTFVAWCLASIVYEFGYRFYIQEQVSLVDVMTSRRNSLLLKHVTHGTVLEIVWTIVPVFVLVAIAVPSFALLYAIDEIVEPTVTIKVVGHQWYWSYEYSDLDEGALAFDSYMIPEADLLLGEFRLLEVDRKLWLPTYTHIRVLVTAADVLHSWAVPSFGVKMDCVPGRLNQVSLFLKREGTFYGQCSELCGVNHGFMPIAVKAVSTETFVDWSENVLLTSNG